jgi:hypothetical protein
MLVFELIELSDEYMLEDLKRKCEEEIMYRLDLSNAVLFMVESYKLRSIVSDNLVESCIANFLEEYEAVILKDQNFEESIT